MALSHEAPDRCPMQISFTPEFAEGLRRRIDIPPGAHHNTRPGSGTVRTPKSSSISIDEQQTPLFGGPGDVRAEVLTRLRTLGRGGGLIIGPTHHVQLDTPVDNIRALVDAVLTTPYSSIQ